MSTIIILIKAKGTLDFMEDRNKYAIGGFFVVAAVTAALSFGAYLFGKYHSAPRQIGVQEDLNQDGVLDLIIEQKGGYKVPMYGLKEGGYITASEMMKRELHSKVDYKALESKLNSKVLNSELNK